MRAPATAAAAPAPRGSAPRRAAGQRLPRVLVGTVLVVGLVLVLGLIRTHVAGPVRISSHSMQPTLHAGDVVLVERRGVGVDDVARGDVVAFRDSRTGEELIKRVVALPGDSVATIDAVLHVNDRPVREPYVDFSDWEGIFGARVTVPPGRVYVLGDNRGASVDSRDYGAIPVEGITGRVLLRLWPPVRVGAEPPQPPRP